MDASEIPKRISQLYAVNFVWEIIVAIALPMTAFAFAGRWFDRRFHFSPWMTIASFLCALALSGWIVYRKAMRFQELQKTDTKRQTRDDSSQTHA